MPTPATSDQNYAPANAFGGAADRGRSDSSYFKASIKELRRPIFKNAPAGQGSSPT